MNQHIAFLDRFAQRYHYPPSATAEFTRIENRLESETDFGRELDAVIQNYMFPTASGMGEALENIARLAKTYGENEYTLDFIFVLRCAAILEGRYEDAGIDKDIYYASCDDFRCKLLECMEYKGVPGTFVAGWNDGTFAMTRFAYGRFQYELKVYDWEKDFVTSCGKVMHVGDTYVNFHIPSSGIPLTDEVRLASYREAYKHYRHLFPDGKVLFCCGSWLLYPKHREFLPKHSNILKFMNDFEMVGWAEKDEFANDWRVYGKDAGLPYDQLPENTSLQRAYKKWLTEGNKPGDAFCCFVFDGENILR